MQTYEDKRNQLQVTNFHNRVFKELSILLNNGVLEKENIPSIEDYQLIKGYEFRMQYRLYKHKEQPVYAFIATSGDTLNGLQGYNMYKLDYSKPDLVRELVQYTKEESKSRTDVIIKALNIIGIILCVLGVLGSLFVAEEGFIFFLGTLVSFVVSALIFFALAAILTHLKSIDEKLSQQE